MTALESKIQQLVDAKVNQLVEQAVERALGGGKPSSSVKKTASVSTGAKRGPKPKAKDDAPSVGRAGSLKDRIITILNQNPDGLMIKDIFQKVQDLVDRGEYETKSKNLGSVIGQAMHTLKKEKLVKKDEDKKYVSLYHPSEETEAVAEEITEAEEAEAETEVETASA